MRNTSTLFTLPYLTVVIDPRYKEVTLGIQNRDFLLGTMATCLLGNNRNVGFEYGKALSNPLGFDRG